MRVEFTDENGDTGVVFADLDVDYTGSWEAAVLQSVESVDEYVEREGIEYADVGTELLVTLSENVPIREIEQVLEDQGP